MVFKGLLVLICGLPFGHLLFKTVDIWHGQGHFFQVGLLIVFCLSFFEKQRFVQPVNKPLGILTLWIGLITSYLWIKAFSATQNYPIKIFFPLFNWLCFIWFYKLCLEYLTKENVETILKWFKYSILILLFYCVLQHFKLDEFFNGLEGYDELVGTIGNPSHLAGYLAILQPLYFGKGLTNILSLILLWLIIILTGSASGVIVGVTVFLFWLLMNKRFIVFSVISAISCVLGGLLMQKLPVFFTFSHRIELWKLMFNEFKVKAITGYGLGFFGVMKYNLKQPFSYWRHAHNDYIQVAYELGIIGLILVLWCIWEYFRMFKSFRTNLTIKLASIFFGFCLLALFSFPVHLWLISVVGMLGYTFTYALKNEVT